MRENVAYEGEYFIIEWYFSKNETSQSLNYFLKLSDDGQNKLLYLFKRIGDFGKISDKSKFRYEGDDIFAFKPQSDRFLCFFVKGNRIIVSNAFRKKTNKLPKNEKLKAMKYRDDYFKRIKSGTYYE